MKFEVQKYYTTFVSFEVEANSKEEAYNKIKNFEIDLIDLQNNLESWQEADQIIPMENNSGKKSRNDKYEKY